MNGESEGAQMKPGWKTTEFWLSLLAVAVTVLMSSDVLPEDSSAVKIASSVSAMLAALGYTVVRSAIKAK